MPGRPVSLRNGDHTRKLKRSRSSTAFSSWLRTSGLTGILAHPESARPVYCVLQWVETSFGHPCTVTRTISPTVHSGSEHLRPLLGSLADFCKTFGPNRFRQARALLAETPDLAGRSRSRRFHWPPASCARDWMTDRYGPRRRTGNLFEFGIAVPGQTGNGAAVRNRGHVCILDAQLISATNGFFRPASKFKFFPIAFHFAKVLKVRHTRRAVCVRATPTPESRGQEPERVT